MFLLHDATRRFLCRWAFGLCCLLPTVGVLAFCYNRHTTGHVRDYEQELSTQLGVVAQVQDVEHTKPGVVLLRGLQLAEPEAREPFFKVKTVETASRNGACVAVASAAEIRSDQWAAVWELLGRRLRKQLPASDIPVRFSTSELTVHNSTGLLTFTEVRGLFEGTDEQESLTLNFRLAGIQMPETAKIRLARDRRQSPPRTTVELHTGGAAIPCEVLLAAIGGAEHLGDRAKFLGSLWLQDTAHGWQGELSGQVLELDLTKRVTDQFPHHRSGTAHIAIQRARIEQGRIVEAAGHFITGPGVVGRSLVQAASEHLHCEIGKAADKMPDLTRYDQLAFAFTLDQTGLVIGGECRDGRAGELLNSTNGALLVAPTEPQPVVNFIRMLSPANNVQVPATRQSDWLSQRLPVPQLVRPDADQPKPAGLKLKP